MNIELQEMLKTIIADALTPITKDIAEIKEDINGMKEDINELKSEVNGIKEEVSDMNVRLTSIESKQDIIFIQTGKLSEFRDETAATLSQIATKEDLEYFDAKASRHEREIFKLKKRA